MFLSVKVGAINHQDELSVLGRMGRVDGTAHSNILSCLLDRICAGGEKSNWRSVLNRKFGSSIVDRRCLITYECKFGSSIVDRRCLITYECKFGVKAEYFPWNLCLTSLQKDN